MSRSRSEHSDNPLKLYLSASRELRCPVCKKMFLQYTPDWYWKHNELVLCSYHCMRVLEKEEAAEDAIKGQTTRNARRGPKRERVLEPVDIPSGRMTSQERESLIVKMREHHYNYKSISKAVGYGVHSVKLVLRKYGIKASNEITEEEVDGYRRLRAAGMSIENIARRYKRAYASVRMHLMDDDGKVMDKGKS